MANTYTKKKTLVINGRKRVIYSKKKSRKEYIKSKGRMLNLKTYLKNKKTKKGSNSTPPKKTSPTNIFGVQTGNPGPSGGGSSVTDRYAMRKALARQAAAKYANRSYAEGFANFNDGRARQAQRMNSYINAQGPSVGFRGSYYQRR